MTIRGIAAVYLLFVILPIIAAAIIIFIAARKRIKLQKQTDPDSFKKKKPSRPGRLRRFFTIKKQ